MGGAIASTAPSNQVGEFSSCTPSSNVGLTLDAEINAPASRDTATTAPPTMTQRNDLPIMNEPEVARGPRTERGKNASKRLQGRTAIARAIIDARLAKRWTQQQLADAAGTKQSRISELEGARGNPTIETIERVAQLLGLEFVLQSQAHADPVVHSAKRLSVPIFIISSCGPEFAYQADIDNFEEAPIPESLLKRIRRPSSGVKIA